MIVLVAGDFCPQHRVAEKFEQGDYESVLGEVKNVIDQVDYSIVNFECPITKGGENPIEKCGSNLQCSEEGIKAVKWAGFDSVTLANNHLLDYGEEGVANTLEACKKYGIDAVGGGMNLQDASQILYKEINGETLAIINCCEHEFSIATENTAGSNPLNPIQQYYAIREARENADYVLVIVHGGNEHYQLPSPRMQETYRFFIDAGADAVVNHHQHCYSGYEVYHDKPIFYGLGNFCFDRPDKRSDIWNEGYMVSIYFTGKKIKTECIPYIQCDEDAKVLILNNGRENKFNKSIDYFNSIISERSKLHKMYDDYIEKNSKLKPVFSPYSNRLLSFLCNHNIIPSEISKKKRTLMLAYIQCESHYPKVIKFLKK